MALQPITVSVVSHGQGALVSLLLEDLTRCAWVSEVVVTLNVPEAEIDCPKSLRSRVRLIRNDQPKGFAANHNQAFRQCRTPLFAVLNPDIRLDSDPLPRLAQTLVGKSAGIVAPSVHSPNGGVEDNARFFPTPARLCMKLLGLRDGRVRATGDTPLAVDWVAGMFMLFRSDTFRDVGGFDEGFFLYYEDVDICVRMWNAGCAVILDPGVSVIHSAQRASRRRPRYMVWHVSSMVRYFCKHLGRLTQRAENS